MRILIVDDDELIFNEARNEVAFVKYLG